MIRIYFYCSLLYLINIAKGIDYLARLKVTHRDLKPDNIMLSSNMEIKLIDFGEAKQQKHELTKTKEKGTLKYMAPENVSDNFNSTEDDIFTEKEFDGNREITKAIDVWAFGLIVSEIFSVNQPWGKLNAILMLTQRVKLPIPPIITDEIIILIIDCCTMNYPEQRIKIDKVINILVTLFKEKLIEYSKSNNLYDLFEKDPEALIFANRVKECLEINTKDNLNFVV